MSDIGTIACPSSISKYCNGSDGLGNFLSVLINIAFVAGGLIFLFMIIYGAIQWLSSGGDKEAMAKARARIVNALIGIILLSLSALIVNIVGTILNFGTIVK